MKFFFSNLEKQFGGYAFPRRQSQTPPFWIRQCVVVDSVDISLALRRSTKTTVQNVAIPPKSASIRRLCMIPISRPPYPVIQSLERYPEEHFYVSQTCTPQYGVDVELRRGGALPIIPAPFSRPNVHCEA